MTNNNRDNIYQGGRRQFLQATTAVTTIGIAGCIADSGENSQDEVPSEQEGISEWGERLNSHAEEADIDWQQFEGTTIKFGMNVHPFTETMEPFLSYFEDLTGITVEFETYPEDQLWQRLTLEFEAESSEYDGFFLGLWPAAQYHSSGWIQNINELIENPDLTDQDWFALDDFTEGVMNSYTYGQGEELAAIPFGVEAYGALGYDQPTFDELGIDPPSDYPSMRDAAQQIHESDDTERYGIASRASATTLSSANWATVFKSYGADWIDYEAREARSNSEEGIASLEIFSEMLGEYGPPDIGSFDWYDSNQTFGTGELGMILHTPSSIGPWEAQQLERTEWVPPVEGPDGDQVAAPWTWGLGISQFSENPGAAWLFIQWAISREANLMQSITAWEGATPYGWAREGYIFDQPEWDEYGLKESWVEAHQQGLSMVPSDPPAVPLDTPQNMDIMSEAAVAMNYAVTGEQSAEAALNNVADSITNYAQDIPEDYID